MTLVSFLAFVLVLLQAWIVWEVSKSPVLPALAVLSAIAALRPTKAELRAPTWAIMAAAGVVVALKHVIAVPLNDEPWAVSMLLMTEFSLMTAALLLAARGKEACESPWLPVLVVPFLLGAFDYGITHQATLTSGVAILVVLGTLALGPSHGRPLPSRRMLLLGGIMTSMMVVIAGQADVYLSPSLQQLKTVSIETLSDKVPTGLGPRDYVRGGGLNSIVKEQTEQPGQIALRVESTAMPGYMRGLAFDIFDGTNWQRRRGAQRKVRRLQPQLSLRRQLNVTSDQQLFALSGARSRPHFRLVVRNDIARRRMYFTPLQLTHMVGKGSELVVDDLGVITEGIEHTLPYTAYASGSSLPDEPGDEEEMVRLLSLPSSVAEALPLYSQRIVGSSTNTTEKVAAVEEYFRSNYKYSLQRVEVPLGEDPILHFLEERPAAHCEYFATTAAMVLRASGVPCRYVTGYVTTEPDPDDEEMWLARNRNAHAWVEAYDRDRGTWLVVEATPGIDSPKSPTRAAGAGPEAIDVTAVEGGIAASLPWLDAIWGFLNLNDPGTVLQTLSGLFLVALGILWLWRRARRRRRGMDGIPQLREIWDRALARRKLRRHPEESLHLFAARLQEVAADETCREAVLWYVQYADCLYSGSSTYDDLTQLTVATQKMLSREPYWVRWLAV